MILDLIKSINEYKRKADKEKLLKQFNVESVFKTSYSFSKMNKIQ